MSEGSDPSHEILSCVTASSGQREDDPIPSKSSTLCSGYDADLDSSGHFPASGDRTGSENSIGLPVEIWVVRAIQPPNMVVGNIVDSSSVLELIGDSEQGNRANVQNLLEGDNSSSAPAPPNQIDVNEEDTVPNLRRKRTEAEGPAGKKSKI